MGKPPAAATRTSNSPTPAPKKFAAFPSHRLAFTGRYARITDLSTPTPGRVHWLYGLESLQRRRPRSSQAGRGVVFPRDPPAGCRIVRASRSRLDDRRVPGLVSVCHTRAGARGTSLRQELSGRTGHCVKILFDANTPAPLAKFLRGHEVTRADELGWQGLTNGALLDSAEQSGFDVLLTCDQNVRYQQNLTGRTLALVILSVNHWPTLRARAARIAAAINFVQTGQVVAIDVTLL